MSPHAHSAHARPLTPAQGLLAAVVTIAVWTAFIVVARASAQRSLQPFDIAWLRFIGAACVLLPWGWWINRQRRLAGQATGWLGLSPLPVRITAAVGVFGSLGYALLAYSGFSFAPAAHASVLMPGSLPLWTAILSALVLGVAITRARAAALGLIVLGDLLVGGMSLLKAFEGSDVWKGDVLFMCAAMCWATYSVLARRYALDAVAATIAVSVFALFTFVPVYGAAVALGWVSSGLGQASWAEMLAQALMQGVGSVAVSGISYTLMLNHYGPVKTTMMTSWVPCLSALAAVVLLGEPLGLNLLLGLALVTLGIFVGVRAASK